MLKMFVVSFIQKVHAVLGTNDDDGMPHSNCQDDKTALITLILLLKICEPLPVYSHCSYSSLDGLFGANLKLTINREFLYS